MKLFRELARTVARDWRRAGGRPGAFPGIAVRALEAFPYARSLEELDDALGRRLERRGALPDQVNLHNTFGQPPVTLFNDGRFVVDLYFWLTADTSIHSHGFRGAFRVLHGSSLHEIFTVRTTRRVAADAALVDLGTPRAELLEPGAVRAIRPGRGLTHGVIHLENPTVTLCVKTINEPRIAQWKYFPNGLALRMRQIEPALIKRIYYFQYLRGRDPERASAFLDRILRRLDRSTAMNLYGAVASGTYDLSEQTALAFAARLRRLHGASEWFRRYEAVDGILSQRLHFEACEDPRGRLLAHLINGAYPAGIVSALLGSVSKAELETAVLELVEVDGLLGVDLSPEERAGIRDLLVNPARGIPEPLRPFAQIRKLRAFLRRG